MKKIIALLLVLAMALSLVACGFAALVAFYQGTEIRDGALIGSRNGEEYKIIDDAAVMEFCKENTAAYKSGAIDTLTYVTNMASKESFWGMDLTTLPGFAQAVASYIKEIEAIGAAAVISNIIK